MSLATFSIVVRPSVHAASVAPAGLLAAVKYVGTNSCNARAAFSPAAICSAVGVGSFRMLTDIR